MSLRFSAVLPFLERKYAHRAYFQGAVCGKARSEPVSAVVAVYPVPVSVYAALLTQWSDCFYLVFVPNSAVNADSDYWCFGAAAAVLVQVSLPD